MVGKHARFIQSEASFARDLQPVIHQFTPERRAKKAAAIARSKDQVVVQIKRCVCGAEGSLLIAAISKDWWNHPRAIAVMLGLTSQVPLECARGRHCEPDNRSPTTVA